MAEFKTQAPDIKPTSGSFFRPTANNSNAEAVASLAQTAGTLLQFADQKHTQKVTSNFARNLDDIFLDAANQSLADANMAPLSDDEIKTLNTTQGRINLIRKMESNRQGLSSLQHRLISEERKALAANPRLAPEIQQMFRTATGTTSGQMAFNMVNDQAGVDIQNQMLAMAGPDSERIQQEETEALIRKTYGTYNPDYETASLEKQSKWFYKFQADQMALKAAKDTAEAQRLAGENSQEMGNAALMKGTYLQVNMLRGLLGGRTAEELSSLSGEAKDQLFANIDTVLQSLQASNVGLAGSTGAETKVVNLVNGLLSNVADAAKKQAGGAYRSDITQAALSITENISRNDLLNAVDLNGVKLVDTLNRAKIAELMPTLMDKIDKSPAAKAAYDNLGLALWAASSNADAFSIQFKNIPSTDIPQQMDMLTTFINTMIDNPASFADSDALLGLNNIIGAFYTNHITHGGGKLSDERLAQVGHSAIKLLSNPKFTKFLEANPVISSGFITLAQDYAQAFGEVTSEAAASLIKSSFSKAGNLSDTIPSDINLDSLTKKTQVGNSIVLEPKFRLASDMERALLPMFKEQAQRNAGRLQTMSPSATAGSTYIQRVLNDKEGEYADIRKRAFKSLFDSTNERLTEFNQKYATNISKLAQVRLNMVPGLKADSQEDFLDAVEVVMGLTPNSYLFTPPPPEPSQTQ